ANMSYWVRTSKIGRGVASRAMHHLASWGCQHLGLQRIEVSMVSTNDASAAAAQKARAQFEGVLRNQARWGGANYDMKMFSFIPADFSSIGDGPDVKE